MQMAVFFFTAQVAWAGNIKTEKVTLVGNGIVEFIPVGYDVSRTPSLILSHEPEKKGEVPENWKELYNSKDYGQYGKNGEMPVCFIVNTDNTGGNSGSPVFNSKGQLIGTAFDRNFEGLTGDIAFRPSSQRAACVDIRYTLFIIDKFAGASHIIDELTICEQ